jgi:hypothetical protein
MPEHVWNDVRGEQEVERLMEEARAKGEMNMTPYLSGWTDAKVIARLKEKLKPPRVEDYEIQFEAKKLRHSGAPSELWGKFETWAAEWLALEREAQSQGVEIEKGRMKKMFEAAIRFHPSIERIVKGKPFESCKQWYGLITKELQIITSYASQMERDVSGGRGGRDATAFQFHQQGTGRGRGGSHVNNHSQQSPHQSPNRRNFSDRVTDARPEAAPAGRGVGRGGNARGNHMEAITWQPSQGGRGRGGRGRARSEPPPGRGDRNGAAKGEMFGTRRPINNPQHEGANVLLKGPYWHENGDLLRCSSALCGAPFDSTVFCQGCGWKGHSREWCYKSSEPGFNATGYWSINRKGQAPLPGKNGEFRGQGRANHMDADEKQEPTQKHTA